VVLNRARLCRVPRPRSPRPSLRRPCSREHKARTALSTALRVGRNAGRCNRLASAGSSGRVPDLPSEMDELGKSRAGRSATTTRVLRFVLRGRCRCLVRRASLATMWVAPVGHWPASRPVRRLRKSRYQRGARARWASGNAARSSLRELIASFMYTWRRCHSIVRGLRNSCAAISGFEYPSRASCAICAS
jgi:hypothetical protein